MVKKNLQSTVVMLIGKTTIAVLDQIRKKERAKVKAGRVKASRLNI